MGAQSIREVKPEDLSPFVGKVRLIDVRQPEEFHGELGHIKTSELVTMGPDLQELLENGRRDETIVFVCRSGGRSGRATEFSQHLGYTHTFNMEGGMLLWNERGLPVER